LANIKVSLGEEQYTWTNYNGDYFFISRQHDSISINVIEQANYVGYCGSYTEYAYTQTEPLAPDYYTVSTIGETEIENLNFGLQIDTTEVVNVDLRIVSLRVDAVFERL